jgi:CSLREA domain-containing protein
MAALVDSRFQGRRPSAFLSARISGNRSDDLIVADPISNELTVLNATSTSVESADGLARFEAATIFDTAKAPVAMLPMRLNVMGAPGFVMLAQGSAEILAASSQPGVTYHVTTLADSQSGTCTAPSGSPLASTCTTLRAAIIAANANPGQDLIVFDVNGTITLSVPGQDDAATVGDLDVTDALTIVGNGISSTVIQGGTSAVSAVDKVFSFNPMGVQSGFAVSISGLTIQFGGNPVTTFGNSEGGAFDFDAGSFDGLQLQHPAELDGERRWRRDCSV